VKVSVCRPSELGAPEIASWHAFQEAGEFGNPFLSPEFARAVGEIFPTARVAVVHDGADLVGFLPFTNGPLRTATGIGGRLANCQAFVCSAATPWPLEDVVRAAGIDLFEFHALVPPLRGPVRTAMRRMNVLAIDLTAGFEEYLTTARRVGGRFVKEIERRRRRFEREHRDDVRFQFAAHDGSSLASLIRWKSAQYRRTGRRDLDLFSRPGVRELVELLAGSTDAAMSGCVSSLSVGERVVAVALSLRSATVLDYWQTGYDVAMARWSPGAVVTLRLIEAAAASGLRTIDLSVGDELYKQRLANTSIEMATGWVGGPSLGMILRRSQHAPIELAQRYILSHPPLRRLTRHALQRYGALRTRVD
jgi:CelD/BcsL family acetyltransferase involved in cellulose biosynthesis